MQIRLRVVACAGTVGAVKAHEPGSSGDVGHPCFTGAMYRILALEYEGRRVGRLIVGPFLPASLAAPPASLFAVDPAIAPDRAQALLGKMPRAKSETVTRIAAHLKSTLDLILFSGHKAHVTSKMHLASVREGYRQLEEKNARLQEAFDRLKELDRLKSNFLATVSHELRTPLTSITGYAQLLERRLRDRPDDSKEVEQLRIIREQSGRMRRLVEDLLDVSRIDRRSGVSVDPIAFDLVEELQAVVARTQRAHGEREVILEAPETLPIEADRDRIGQVLTNLADNAAKYSPDGGSIRITARRLGADVEVRVADRGVGIPDELRERVFDLFVQADGDASRRRFGGLGLGLYITRAIVDAHGGRVWAEPNREAGGGTVIVVRLPVQARRRRIGPEPSVPGEPPPFVVRRPSG